MKLAWDQNGERFYETGVDRGVLFPFSNSAYGIGVAWNGLTAVTESPSGAEATAIYADNIKYLNLLSNEDFGCSIEAYTYPKEFAKCDGSAFLSKGVKMSQQKRSMFGFSYRTKIGNDEDGDDKGYKVHLVYGCLAAPSEKAHNTINESPEAITMSWEITTTPVEVPGFKPTAHIEISSLDAVETELANFENLLYGADDFDATKTYAVGEYVTHGTGATAKTYKCTTAVTVAGEWDESDWTEIGVAGPHLPLPEELTTIFTSSDND